MVWTEPKTWTNEPLVAGDMNTHLRDNLEALKDPPSANYEADEASNYSTTSTSFVDVHATNLSLTIETKGGDVMVHFHGNIDAASYCHLDLEVDDTRIGGDDGICYAGVTHNIVSFTRLLTNLAEGSHTFKLQWKVNSGAGTLFAGAGTTYKDVIPQFWAREVS